MPAFDSRPTACSTTITITAAALLGLGVVMVFSAGADLSTPSRTLAPWQDPAIRQAAFSGAALAMLLLAGRCPYETWRIRRRTLFQPTVLLIVVTAAFLCVVLVPGIGQIRNGARRWLMLGHPGMGFGFQPSEMAKISLLLFVAAFCAWLGDNVRSFWRGFLPALAVIALFSGVIGMEDFGTGALLAVVGGCLLLGAGARFWHLLLAGLPGLVGLAYLIAMKPYRLQRLVSFLNPEADPQGAGYHQIQSLVTIASGRWWGQGLGAGIQKYGYLPEGRTDFIFAVICEELGIVGGIFVVALFGILVWQGKRAMESAATEFGRLLALGVTLMIGLQSAMNVAVVTVSVPTKGIGLPLISAGGTGVVLFGTLIGILANVARRRNVPLSASIERRTGFRTRIASGVAPAV